MSFFKLLSQCISSNLSVLIFSGFCTNCGIYLKAKLLPDNGGNVCRSCLAKGKCKQCGRHLDTKCMHDHHNCNNCVRKQAWLKQTGCKRRDFKNVFHRSVHRREYGRSWSDRTSPETTTADRRSTSFGSWSFQVRWNFLQAIWKF